MTRGKSRHGLVATIATSLVGTLALFTASVFLPGALRDAAHAQSPTPPAREAGCTPRPGMLGVARVLEIDTSQAPKFGLQQYPEHDFLRENEVVLTFDDGPVRRNTRLVLDALAAHCTKATFYMVGQMALSDPEMVREVARAGHTIGIHTWSHRNLRAAGKANAEQEIELGISAVQRALGRPVAPFFRFPYLADNPAMLAKLAERQFAVFSIDVDSKDYRTHSPAEMRSTVMAALQAKRKGIMLFHDIQPSTAHGIRGILDELASRGYRVVHVIPKGQAATIPRYDAMAETEHARRSKIASVTPMAQRSVTWPMAPIGVPVEAYQPGTGPDGVRAAVRAPAKPGVASPKQQAPAGVPTAATSPAVVAPAPPPAAVETSRPVFRGTTDEDDWRRRVFQ